MLHLCRAVRLLMVSLGHYTTLHYLQSFVSSAQSRSGRRCCDRDFFIVLFTRLEYRERDNAVGETATTRQYGKPVGGTLHMVGMKHRRVFPEAFSPRLRISAVCMHVTQKKDAEEKVYS